MKKFIYLMSLPLVVACTEVKQADYDRLVAQKDSVEQVNREMTSVIAAVTGAIDEIAVQEGMIFFDDANNDINDKQVLRDHINAYKDRLAQQKEQIASLEKNLKNSQYANSQLKKLVEQLKTEIVEKEQKIEALESELADSKTTIADLRSRMGTVRKQLETVIEDKAFLESVANTQDSILNEGYFIVASKKELKDLNLVSGMFKKKANYANIDKSHFTKIDIREFSEITIENEPKLITEKPESSYNVTKNSDGTYTLHITNPTEFWSVSPFLIIQAK